MPGGESDEPEKPDTPDRTPGSKVSEVEVPTHGFPSRRVRPGGIGEAKEEENLATPAHSPKDKTGGSPVSSVSSEGSKEEDRTPRLPALGTTLTRKESTKSPKRADPPSPPTPPATTMTTVDLDNDLKHIVVTVMGQADTSPLCRAFVRRGYVHIPDVMTMTPAQIEHLDYNDGGTITLVPEGTRNKIRAFQAWIHYLKYQMVPTLPAGAPLRVDFTNHTGLTQADYDHFRANIYVPGGDHRAIWPLPGARPLTSTTPPTTTTHAPRSTPAEMFNKSIKRDKSQCVLFDNEDDWYTWKNGFEATVQTHGCENVLDKGYSPTTPQDKDLFDAQQKFIWSVFIDKIKTRMGQHCVGKHQGTSNAQELWQDLVKYHSSDHVGRHERERLHKRLTTDRLMPGHRGGCTAFITEWQDNLRRYQEITPASQQLSDPNILVMFQNALKTHKAYIDLESMINIQSIGNKTLKTNMTHATHTELALNKAQDVDKADNDVTINYHSFQNPSEYHNDNGSYQINYHGYRADEGHGCDEFDMYNIFMASMRPTVPAKSWKSLTPKDQKAWDTLSDQGKRVLLWAMTNYKAEVENRKRSPSSSVTSRTSRSSGSRSTDSSARSKQPYKPSSLPRRKINFTETCPSQSDDDEGFDTSREEEEEEEDPGEDSDKDDLQDGLMAFMASSSDSKMRALAKTPPGDTRRLLSTHNKKANNKKQGKKRIGANVHMIQYTSPQYQVMNSNISSSASLVDRGANGGLGGSNLRKMKESGRHITITGIDERT